MAGGGAARGPAVRQSWTTVATQVSRRRGLVRLQTGIPAEGPGLPRQCALWGGGGAGRAGLSSGAPERGKAAEAWLEFSLRPVNLSAQASRGSGSRRPPSVLPKSSLPFRSSQCRGPARWVFGKPVGGPSPGLTPLLWRARPATTPGDRDCAQLNAPAKMKTDLLSDLRSDRATS